MVFLNVLSKKYDFEIKIHRRQINIRITRHANSSTERAHAILFMGQCDELRLVSYIIRLLSGILGVVRKRLFFDALNINIDKLGVLNLF